MNTTEAQTDAEALATERRLGVPESSPAAPSVLEAQDAYDVGDYKRVRELAAELMASSDAQVARAGLALHTKVAVDPVQIVCLTLCFMAFLFALYEYY